MAYETLIQDCYAIKDDAEHKLELQELERGKDALKKYFVDNYADIDEPFEATQFADLSSTISTSSSPQKSHRRRRAHRATLSTSSNELDQFFAITALGVQGWEVDPLAWWYAHRAQYPKLYVMARDVLAIPGESSESVNFKFFPCLLVLLWLESCTHPLI
jgi:hypothetical protein